MDPNETIGSIEQSHTVIRDALDEALARGRVLEGALTKIDLIRNSIIAHQTVNWSAHVYPLVEALHDAGFDGEEYEVAKANAETLHQRIATLEAALEWYAERARSLAGKMGAVKSESEMNYVLAVLTELSLDGGHRAALAQPVGGGR